MTDNFQLIPNLQFGIILTMATYTGTRTRTRYSLNLEVKALQHLLADITKFGEQIHFSAFDLAELAGIGRFTLNTIETLREDSNLVTAQYEDAKEYLERIGLNASQNRIIIAYLADLINRIGEDERRGTPIIDWANDPYNMMLSAKEQKKSWFNLTQEQGFLLGLSAYILAGDPKDRHNWSDREQNFNTQFELLHARGFFTETHVLLSEHWAEIRRPSLEIPHPPGQLK